MGRAGRSSAIVSGDNTDFPRQMEREKPLSHEEEEARATPPGQTALQMALDRSKALIQRRSSANGSH
jgi:hypothetical protein